MIQSIEDILGEYREMIERGESPGSSDVVGQAAAAEGRDPSYPRDLQTLGAASARE